MSLEVDEYGRVSSIFFKIIETQGEKFIYVMSMLTPNDKEKNNE